MLERAKTGASFKALHGLLIDRGVDERDAEQTLRAMVDEFLLISEGELDFVGIHPEEQTLGQLSKNRKTCDLMRSYEHSVDALRTAQEAPIGGANDYYRAAMASLTNAGLQFAECAPNVVLRYPNDKIELSQALVDRVGTAVEVLRRITPVNVSKQLAQFSAKFEERFGDATVPLVVALDFEHGVGFDKALSSEALTALGHQQEETASALLRPTDVHLLRRVSELQASRATVLELNERDLAALAAATPARLPDSFAVRVTLLGPVADPTGTGQCRIAVHATLGPSGARWLGRFADADAELTELLRLHLAKEEQSQPAITFAEISFPPMPRFGNVTYRPELRANQIRVFGPTRPNDSTQLSLTDLSVAVERSRIVLFDSRTGSRVEPRLTSALSIAYGGTRIAEFLGLLQNQDVTSVFWNWGALKDLPFLPRVQYGEVIFSPASWKVSTDEFAKVFKAAHSERVEQVKTIQRRTQLPQFVGLVEGDNVLPIDLYSELSLESARTRITRGAFVKLCELFVDSQSLIATDRDGAKFCHEVVIPFSRRIGKEPVPHRARPSMTAVSKGSNYMSYELYTGEVLADRALDELRSFATSAALHGADWFFLRYAVPSWHVRFRCCAPDELHGALIIRASIESWAASLVRRQLLWKFDSVTYRPESRRYGGALGLDLSERLFCADSCAIISVVPEIARDEHPDHRWLLGVLNVHSWFDAFRVPRMERLHMLHSISESRGEFGANHPDLWTPEERARGRAVNLLFRNKANDISDILHAAQQPDWARPFANSFSERWVRAGHIVDRLRFAARDGELGTSLHTILSSHLHMSLNRLLRSSQITQERVIYQLLLRHYRREVHATAVGTT